jgi:hypothetical protein
MFSGNVNGQAWNGAIVPPWRSTASAEHLGGIVFSASIVYDVDQDGDFENPASTGGNAASVDEQYNALMYIGNKATPGCFADFNNDLFSDAIDYDLFIAAWLSLDCIADSNRDGFVDAIDYDIFVAEWLTPCP